MGSAMKHATFSGPNSRIFASNSETLASQNSVLYPATSLHRVETVSSGQRLVCVGWIQSFVRDPRVREMIFDLSRVKQELFRTQGHSELFDLVAKTQSNLLRLNAEV
jgi:PKHD-type hydroxylase